MAHVEAVKKLPSSIIEKKVPYIVALVNYISISNNVVLFSSFINQTIIYEKNVPPNNRNTSKLSFK